MMSKKDYQAIAKAVYYTRQAEPGFSEHHAGAIQPPVTC